MGEMTNKHRRYTFEFDTPRNSDQRADGALHAEMTDGQPLLRIHGSEERKWQPRVNKLMLGLCQILSMGDLRCFETGPAPGAEGIVPHGTTPGADRSRGDPGVPADSSPGEEPQEREGKARDNENM